MHRASLRSIKHTRSGYQVTGLNGHTSTCRCSPPEPEGTPTRASRPCLRFPAHRKRHIARPTLLVHSWPMVDPQSAWSQRQRASRRRVSLRPSTIAVPLIPQRCLSLRSSTGTCDPAARLLTRGVTLPGFGEAVHGVKDWHRIANVALNVISLVRELHSSRRRVPLTKSLAAVEASLSTVNSPSQCDLHTSSK